MNKKIHLPEGFTITAHTGCEGSEYNSLESIRIGAQYGEIIEVDLNFTKDKKAVLAHTFANKDSVPIDDVFALLSELPGKKMNIDVKIAPDLRAVYNSAVKHGVLDRIFFTGIDKFKLEAAKKATPEIPFYINITVTGKDVTGAHGITVHADLLPEEVECESIDAVIFPGGMPGSLNLDASPYADEFIGAVQKNGGRIAAICAAPLVLGRRSLLNGRRATCFPGFENELVGATATGESVVTDGNITTARDFRAAVEFGDELARLLK